PGVGGIKFQIGIDCLLPLSILSKIYSKNKTTQRDD
ncbi:unnamed protein product, partial [marine sediment metagenome]